MQKKCFLLSFFLFSFFCNYSQTISGSLSQLTNQEIKLEGFNGLKTYYITQSKTDEKGNLKLTYSKEDYGVGYLITADEKPLFVILSGEDIEIRGEALSVLETIRVKKGKENIWFEQYAKEHPSREQALSAWMYLEKIYTLNPLFAIQKSPVNNIQTEKQRIKDEDVAFLSSLPKNSYVSWFLPVRKLVSDVATLAQYRPEEIPSSIAAFRALDYTDPRLYKSGLFKDAIESHFWLLENSGKPIDSVYLEMKVSIDAMMFYLIKDEEKLNEVTDFLFDLLERHSLFQASEYLATKVLNETSCSINSDLAKQLETYRVMKKGNIAPEITFANCNSKLKSLSDIKNKNKLVVFGASWCTKCTEEIPKLFTYYQNWKNKYDIEVVFISLDKDKESFEKFIKDFTWISICDYKGWESIYAKDYYVFGTPTMYLLDSNNKIVLKPNSPEQIEAWLKMINP